MFRRRTRTWFFYFAPIGSAIRVLMCCSVLAALSLSELPAQWLLDSPFEPHRSGFYMEEASAWAGYSSLSIPLSNALRFVGPLEGIGSDEDMGVSATFVVNRFGDKNRFSLMFTPSYTGWVRYTQWNAMNQQTRLDFDHMFNARWRYSLLALSSAITLDQSLFTPATYSPVKHEPIAFDEIAELVVSGKTGSLMSSLTGTENVSPAATLLFGNRQLFNSLHSSLSYSMSPLTEVSVGISGSVIQRLPDLQERELANHIDLATHISNGTVYTGLLHKLSPRSSLEIELNASRAASIYDYNYQTLTGKYSRVMNRHWFTYVLGGVGGIEPVGQRRSVLLHSGPRYVADAGVGFQTYAHTVMVSARRWVSDAYGLGTGTTFMGSAAWNWDHPARNWGLCSSFTEESIRGLVLNINAWLVSGGFIRHLNRSLDLNIEYVYLASNHFVTDTHAGLERHSARVTLTWRPGGQIRERRTSPIRI